MQWEVAIGLKLKPINFKEHKKSLREIPIHLIACGFFLFAGLLFLGGIPSLFVGMEATITDPTVAVYWGAYSTPFVISGVLSALGIGLYTVAIKRNWLRYSLQYFKDERLPSPPPWPILLYGVILGLSSLHLFIMQLRIPNYPFPMPTLYYSVCFALSVAYIALGNRLLRQKKKLRKPTPQYIQIKLTFSRIILFVFGCILILFGFPQVFTSAIIFLRLLPTAVPPDHFFPFFSVGLPMLATGIWTINKARRPFKKEIREYEQSEEARKEKSEIEQLKEEVTYLQQRNDKLTQILADERAEKSRLEKKVHELQEQNNELKQREMVTYQRDPRDIRKIKNLKGLIRELQAEIGRLNDLVPKSHDQTEVEARKPALELKAELDLSPLRGKTVAVFGRLSEEREMEGVRLIYHNGDRVNLSMARAAKQADELVVLTRLVSHEVMWRLKEYAAEEEKGIQFLRETGEKRILEKTVQTSEKD